MNSANAGSRVGPLNTNSNKKKKVAVLIPVRNDSLYKTIMEFFPRPKQIKTIEFQFDLYFIFGLDMGPLELRLRNSIEEIRYSRAWPLLRLYDTAFIWVKDKKPRKIDVDVTSGLVRVEIKDDIRHLAIKMYESFRLMNSMEYDFVIRTTLSSIFNVELLIDFLRIQKPYNLLFAGRALELPNSPIGVSGSFMILSRETLDLLQRQRVRHNHGVIDDVGISRILSQYVAPSLLKSIIVSSEIEAKNLNTDQLSSTVHFRCRTNTNPRDDLPTMHTVRRTLGELGKITF
jgi:hypothetical protein